MLPVLAVLTLLPGPVAHAQTTEPSSIVASGEGVVKVAPDQAWVRVGTESRSKVSKEAQQRNAEVMTAVQQKLTALGIPKDAVRTVGIDLQPEFDYQNGRQTLRGYVARNTIEVRIDDFAKVGDVLDAAVSSGATNVHDLRFDVKNRDAVEQQALQRAVEDGMAKANSIATAAKRGVDRILRIEENFLGGPQPVERAVMMRMAAADAPTPVAAGEIEIRAQVRLTVAIKGSPQVPRRNRAIRLPDFAHLPQPFWVGAFAQPIHAVHGVHQPQIVGRQHVLPSESEHQENLGGPPADPFHRHQLTHHLVIGMLIQPMQIQPSIDHLRREILDEGHFRPA